MREGSLAALDERLGTEREYWLKKLSGNLPFCTLPLDYQRNDAAQRRGELLLDLDPVMGARLFEVCAGLDSLILSALIAVVKIILHKYCGTEEVVVGTTIHLQHSEIAELNRGLALRDRIEPESSLRDVLVAVKQTLAEAYENQKFPLQRILDLLGIDRERSSLFGIVVILTNVNDREHARQANSDALFVFTRTGRRVTGVIEYDARLFAKETVEVLAKHFRQLLQSVLTEPETKLAALDLLADADRQRFLWDFNRTEAAYPSERSVNRLFEQQAGRTPDSEALVLAERALTYRELNEEANRIAHFLKELGVAEGDRVAILLRHSFGMVAAVLAVLKAGAAYVPLDPDHPRARLEHAISDSGCRLVLTESATGDVLGAGSIRMVLLDREQSHLKLQKTENPSFGLAGGEGVAYVIYTSGSTGRPKGVQIRHASLVNYICWAAQVYLGSERLSFALYTSLAFDLTKTSLFTPLITGNRIVIYPKRRQGEYPLLDLIEDDRVDVVKLTPSHLELVRERNNRQSRIKRFIVGGEPLSTALALRVSESFGGRVEILNEYGPTEATVGCMLHRFNPAADMRTYVPIGQPAANTKLYVLDALLRPIAENMVGELFIGGDGVADGYLGQPDRTAERFLADPFSPGARMYRSGDLVRWLPGGVLDFVGRSDEQVKIRGHRLELNEVRGALNRHPEIRDSIVLTAREPQGILLVAYYVSRHEIAENELRDFLKELLLEEAIPAVFAHLKRLPLTLNAKVNVEALPPLAEVRKRARPGYVPPRTHAEKVMAEIWSAVLGVTQVGVHDNFFHLGGDSIVGIRVVARANQAGFRLAPRQIFQFQTVAELTAALDEVHLVLPEQEAVHGEVPLTPIQRDFFATVGPEPHHYNQALVLEVRDECRSSFAVRWHLAFRRLLEHHDALRMRFEKGVEGWAQRNGGLGGDLPFTILDLSLLPENGWRPVFQAAATDLQASLDLSRGPLLRAVLCRLATGEPDRLLMVIHHLVVDGVSWRILVDDLEVALQASSRLPSKTTSFKVWAEALVGHAQSDVLKAEALYWLGIQADLAPALPVDFPEGENSVASARQVEVLLSREETSSLLHVVPAAFHTQINDVLLTALARACSFWTGQPLVLIALEGHGREEILPDLDLSRTVGWFTSVFPVLLRLSPGHGPDHDLKSIKEQLRAIPRRGIGYGLLRYLSPPGELADQFRQKAEPELSFNYLGRFDEMLETSSTFRIAGESRGPTQSPRQRRRHVLEVTGFLADGRLRINWGFSESLHRPATIEGLAASFLGHLRDLIEICSSVQIRGYTPSDFPLAGLDQVHLDRLLARFEIEDIYPLSPLQQGLLFHSLDATGPEVYFRQLSCVLRGNLNASALRLACREVLERHPVLRTSFAWQDLREPLQLVNRRVELSLDEQDWRALPLREREERAAAFRRADSERGIDLEAAPLMRFALMRLEQDRHLLIWSFHHLVSDGWSFSLLLAELFAFYEAFRLEQPPLGRERPKPFREYIAWLCRRDLAAAESFWRRELAGFTVANPLLGERELRGSRLKGGAQGQRQGFLSASSTAALQSWARQHQLTLNTVLQGAWALLLSRYSGDRDIVFGAVSSGRSANLPGIESMLGVFINTLPVRTQTDTRGSLIDWLQALQERQVEAREHEHSPLSQVQVWSDVPRGRPLFHTLMAFENYPVDESMSGRGSSLAIEKFEFPETTNYPLTLMAAPGPALPLRLMYEESWFEGVAAERLLWHFIHILDHCSSHHGRPLDVPVISVAERHQILLEWNDCRKETCAPVLIHQLFEQQAEQRPDSLAALFGDQCLTYGELNRKSNQLAHHLRALRVHAGTRVGVYLDRSLEMIPALVGILKSGAAYIPLDSEYPQARIEWMLDSLGTNILVTHRRRLPFLRAMHLPALAHVICLDEDEYEENLRSVGGVSAPVLWRPSDLERQPIENPLPVASPDDVAYVIFTSGSTGRPKGTVLCHRPVVNLIRWVNSTFGVGEQDRVLFITSLCFDLSVYDIFGLLAAGGSICIVAKEDVREPRNLLRLLREKAITYWDSAPAALQQLVPFFEPETDETVGSSLRLVFLSGDWIPVTLPDQVRTTFPDARIIALGGATEAAIWSNYFPVGEVGADWASIPYGRPIDNARYHILDSALEPCPIGVPGDLYIAGGCLALGYTGEPALTAERFLPDPVGSEAGARWYWTGDRARYLGAGDIEFLGRVDHQVKIRGYRIELGEIEAALVRHPDLSDAVVLAREDEPGHRRLVAYFVARRQPSPEAGALRSFLALRLPEYMVPAAYVELEALPVTTNGKLDRKSLPRPETARPRAGHFVAARNPTEQRLAEIWAELLRVEQVGAHDNYFELGGDSILSIQLVYKAAQAGLQISTNQIFEHPTVAELAAVAGTELATSPSGPVVGPVTLTPSQRWYFEPDPPDPHHFNQALLLAVPTGFDAGRVGAIFEHLLGEHDAFHMRFHRTQDGWTQEYAGWDGHVPLSVIDLSAVQHGSSSVLTHSAEQVQESLVLEAGSLLRVVLFRLGTEETDRLLIVAHHLVIDGVSWRILLADMANIDRSLNAGEPVTSPRRTSSFQRWAELLSEYANSAQLRGQLGYWAALERQPAIPLPLDHCTGPNSIASAGGVAISIDATTTRALLQEVPAAYRTQINDVLLTALARSLASWTGSPALVVELEGHGREAFGAEADVSRTVGWFTSFFPVRLDLDNTADLGESLRRVKEQLRAIPDRGLGYGLLRYLCEDGSVVERLRRAPRPEVSFNYLGQLDQALPAQSRFSLAPEPSGATESRRQLRRAVLAVNAHVLHGSLTVNWVYSRHLHRRSTVERLAERFVEELRSLVAHCLSSIELGIGGYTPSDFPLAKLGQADLDRLLGRERGIEDLYPLSPLQEGILFHSLYSPDSGVYVVQVCCELRGRMDVEAFAQAWRQVVERHPVLRTSFHWQDLDRPLQAVHDRAEVVLERQDWRGLSAAEQEYRLESLVSSDRTRSFDFSRAPLMRWVLIETGENDWRFLWSQHHILLDGWSSSAVTGEFLACYEALRSKADPDLPPRAPYRDFLGWLERQDLSSSEEYWRRTLADWNDPTPLGVDVAEGRAEGSQTISAWLTPRMTSLLRQQARRQQVTLNTLVQGAWGVLLGRYSGRTDVVFGVTVSGRPADLSGVESMVGVFINTLPARLKVSGETRLLPWLQELQRQQAELRRHEHNPLVRIQGWSEVGRGVPLFESILVFENYPRDASLRSVAVSLEVGEVYTAEQNNYPLAVVVVPGDRLLIRVDYASSRFDAVTVERMQGHLRNLLESLGGEASDPEGGLLGDLPLLSEPERHEILLEWGRSPAADPGEDTVIRCIESAVARWPEATAVEFGEERMSYRELADRSHLLAHRLVELGVGGGDRVGILLPHSPAMVVGVLGVLKSGAAYVPFDPGHPRHRLASMAADAAVSAWLSEGDLAGFLDIGTVPVIDPRSSWRGPNPGSSPLGFVSSQSVAYVIYTSGSTGEPKGVSVPHGALLNYAMWASETYLREEGWTVPLYSSLSFDLSVTSIFPPLLTGNTIRIYRETDEPAICGVFREGCVEMVKLTPSHLELVKGLDNRVSRIRRLIVGGEQLERRLAQEVLASFGGNVEIFNEYGPTEATVGCMLHRFDPRLDLRSAVPIGRPAAGSEIYVLDDDLRPVPERATGELYLGGPVLAIGYLRRPDLTAQRFVPHPFACGQRLYRTGDLARMLSGGHLEFLGRRDEQVKIRGYRVELGEVVAALMAHPQVREAVVVARQDLPGGHGLAAYFVAAGEDAPSAGELRSFLVERLPEAMVPAAYLLLSRIPLTRHGKIDRASLATDGVRLPSRTQYAAPETEVESALADLWKQVLQVDSVGMYDNFFDLGGHSLLMLQLHSKVQARFGAGLKMVELFELPTVSSMARRLVAGGSRDSNISARGLDRAAARLETMQTRAQQRQRDQRKRAAAELANG